MASLAGVSHINCKIGSTGAIFHGLKLMFQTQEGWKKKNDEQLHVDVASLAGVAHIFTAIVKTYWIRSRNLYAMFAPVSIKLLEPKTALV